MKEKRRKQSGASKLPVLADVYAAHEKGNQELYIRMYGGRLPGGGSYLGTDNTSGGRCLVPLDTSLVKAFAW
jgi:hypothetical protein